jgi:X-X-X-Leu-X-X-Gly heptad repeat protein
MSGLDDLKNKASELADKAKDAAEGLVEKAKDALDRDQDGDLDLDDAKKVVDDVKGGGDSA